MKGQEYGQKNKEKFYSGGLNDRIPAMFVLCIIVSGGIWKYSETVIEEKVDIDISLFVGIIFWALLSAFLFTVCKKIMVKLYMKKEDELFQEKRKEMMERKKENK